jgi:hypothetical protein
MSEKQYRSFSSNEMGSKNEISASPGTSQPDLKETTTANSNSQIKISTAANGAGDNVPFLEETPPHSPLNINFMFGQVKFEEGEKNEGISEAISKAPFPNYTNTSALSKLINNAEQESPKRMQSNKSSGNISISSQGMTECSILTLTISITKGIS